MQQLDHLAGAAGINSSVSFLLWYFVQKVKFDNKKVSKCEKYLLVELIRKKNNILFTFLDF